MLDIGLDLLFGRGLYGMQHSFEFDVFLSHSSLDTEAVRSIAWQLRESGLRVWFDAWEIKPGDSIPAKIEYGLEHSRVLVLCMSEHAFGTDWVQLESHTFRFRDPLNNERRFIPLRLDQTSPKGSLAQFLYIDWEEDRDEARAKLVEACRRQQSAPKPITEIPIQLDYKASIGAYAFNPDGRRVISADVDQKIRLWDIETKRCLRVLEGHTASGTCVVWSADQRHCLSGSSDNSIRLWDLRTGQCLQVLTGHTASINCVVWHADQRLCLSGSSDNSVRLWDIETGHCIKVFEGHTGSVRGVAWVNNCGFVLSGSEDGTLRQWDVETGSCVRSLRDHSGAVTCVAWSNERSRLLSGSDDSTVRLWELEAGRCLRVFEGHTGGINSVAWSPDGHRAASTDQSTVMLWNTETGHCMRVLQDHFYRIQPNVGWSADQSRAFSGDAGGCIQIWKVSENFDTGQSSTTDSTHPSIHEQIQYTNAKVLLVGESGAGKTGLSKVIAGEKWQASDSTVGAWATHWKLGVFTGDGVEREIWLWDFGGQADQRLIHQLYMEDTALAALVFDGQKEDLFETIGQWDRDMTRASNKKFVKLLVAGRVDTGGLRASRSQIETFAKERGFSEFLETSAKIGTGCAELKRAIVNGIQWDDVPWRSSPLLFKRLKEEIIHLKDEGWVLMRFNELRDTLQLRLFGKVARFTDQQLKAVVRLLTGPGVVWELKFGNWVLLQPERINAYAQAVIQTMDEDEYERGCILEERVLNGELAYQSSLDRLGYEEERFVLLAMHQMLVERGLCLREHSDKGPLLIFPSYYRRERQELARHPAVLVSYTFGGFLDDIYARLVVRLHYTSPFNRDQLWRYAADFRTLTGKTLGIKLTRLAEGTGELAVYFDPTIPIEEKIIFSKYVHEHLLQNGKDVVRLRHYVCPRCSTPVGNREVAMKRLNSGKKDILCVDCENRVLLWDQMEELFASEEAGREVRELQEQSAIVLDNESKERALVGEVISTVALAGQICREFSVSDHGIDMEIEFKSDSGRATGRKVYLQLKSGDSHLKKRKSDGAEIFRIDTARHAVYWGSQEFPVLLVIRNSKGEIHWMDVRDYLRQAKSNEAKPLKQIVFESERFDVMSVRRWRDLALDGLDKT
jgi:small GTP-binding protein